MPFEDLLVAKSRCKACNFIDLLPEGLAAEVRAAVAKPKYSHDAISKGMREVARAQGIDAVQVPSDGTVRNHREAEHA